MANRKCNHFKSSRRYNRELFYVVYLNIKPPRQPLRNFPEEIYLLDICDYALFRQ